MRRALERHKAGEAHVIPILLRPCDWHTAPFGHLQALPRNGQAITIWPNQDEAFLQVSQGLRTLLKQPLPLSTMSALAIQNRVNMLTKLQRMYDELLDDSLQQLTRVTLPLSSVPDAIHTSANFLLRRSTLPAQPLAPGTTIQQVYQQANQELLILGEPGAGKSTLLYQLGQELLTQAQYAQQRIPVVFPLASWSQKQLPLDEWLVEQLCSPLYQVPRKQSQQWVDNQHILPLLDGLDEMDEAARPACIAAINVYHRTFPLCPLVVCSRSQEYRTASQHERLHLYSAVEIQPLTVQQQEEALQQEGSSVDGLRAELATNEELRELIQTPLWLNLLIVATRETPLRELPRERADIQREIVRRYVERMCERKGDAGRYPLQQTVHWLGFLATQMRQRNQVTFAIEELQPDWLSKKSRGAYHWSVGLVFGLLSGLVSGLVVATAGGLTGGLIVALSFGLTFGLIGGQENNIALAERLVRSGERSRSVLVFALVFGSILGLIAALAFGLIFGLVVALVAAPVSALAFGLILSLKGQQIVDRSTFYPGKGLYSSMRNGLLIGLFSVLAVGLPFGVIIGLTSARVGGLAFGLFVALASTLGGALIGGLVFALISGLGSALQHLILRVWLAHTNCFPWQTVTFLNDSCQRALLKRVGGTYRFIHRLVFDYFAQQESLDKLSPPSSIRTEMSDETQQH